MRLSGQRPQLTKRKKSTACKTEIFVPCLIPGLTASSNAASSSTSPVSDLVLSVFQRQGEVSSKPQVTGATIQNLKKNKSERRIIIKVQRNVCETPLRELSSHEAATALLRAAATTSVSSRARSRSRSLALLPKRAPRRSSSAATVARGSVALGESGLVTGLAVKSCPPVPPAQLRLSRVSRALHAASGTPRPSGEALEASARPAQASEAPRVSDVASDSDSDWNALLDAHGLTPPPNVAAAAAACARPLSAPCGAKFKRPCRVSHATRLALVKSLLCTPSWQCALGQGTPRVTPDSCWRLFRACSCSALRTWPSCAQPWFARDCFGGLCRPFRGSCPFVALLCEFSWGPALMLKAHLIGC